MEENILKIFLVNFTLDKNFLSPKTVVFIFSNLDCGLERGVFRRIPFVSIV